MFGEENKEKGVWEKLNEIAMELQENEANMSFMDEYTQKFYRMAKEDEKSFRRAMAREAGLSGKGSGSNGQSGK